VAGQAHRPQATHAEDRPRRAPQRVHPSRAAAGEHLFRCHPGGCVFSTLAIVATNSVLRVVLCVQAGAAVISIGDSEVEVADGAGGDDADAAADAADRKAAAAQEAQRVLREEVSATIVPRGVNLNRPSVDGLFIHARFAHCRSSHWRPCLPRRAISLPLPQLRGRCHRSLVVCWKLAPSGMSCESGSRS